MKGYSKMKLMNSTSKSRSMDFSDLHSLPDHNHSQHQPKPIEIKTPKLFPIFQKSKSIKKPQPPSSDTQFKNHGDHQEEDDKLPNSTTTNAESTAPGSTFKLEKQRSTRVQSTVKRAFSLRRSSSVSESYCRIHDQCAAVEAPFDEEEEEAENGELQTKRSVQMEKKQKRFNVVKACKRIFGL